jgi:hypothetical protein
VGVGVAVGEALAEGLGTGVTTDPPALAPPPLHATRASTSRLENPGLCRI